jgi:hypothetical protein
MQEMAAIDEVSIGNAPPSEREEDLSEIGELADFAARTLGNFSMDTPTTAQESASLISGGKPTSSSSDHDREATGVVALSPRSDDIAEDETEVVRVGGRVDTSLETADSGYSTDSDEQHEVIVNRTLRPGMVVPRPAHQHPHAITSPPLEPMTVEDFDFDKDAPRSPVVQRDDSFRNLPHDPWSPPGNMYVSPITMQPAAVVALSGQDLEPPPMTAVQMPSGPPLAAADESTPLLSNVPNEIITTSQRTESFASVNSEAAVYPNHHFLSWQRLSIGSIMDSVISEIRSEEEDEKQEINHESEDYLKSSIWQKAFPERLFALTVTLIFEIPVLLMISGGSDALCFLIGRKRYQLLMGFIPLTSAISGNVGLQASTLTTRAISHRHVTSSSYKPWFVGEIGAACLLGVGMGCLLGSIAFFASGFDIAFGTTIFVAQFISITTAGCTGTFAPLLFSFIFKQDSGKWGGPLETAIQDIVGSFAMVIISYKILQLFGPGPIDPSDVCAPGDVEDR